MKIDRNRIKLLGIVVIIAGAFSVPGILSAPVGLPYLHYYDEPIIINEAVNTLKRATDDNDQTRILPSGAAVVYGGFMRYTTVAVDLAYYQYLKLTDPDIFTWQDIKTDIEGSQPLTISHPGFFYWSRVWHVALGALGCVFMFLLVRLRFGVMAGIISVLFLLANDTYYSSSFIVTTNVPLSTWAIVTLYFAIRYNHSKSHRDLLLSLVAAGLATSTKMTGAATILIPVSAALINYGEFRGRSLPATIWKGFYHGLIPIIIFLIWNPSFWLNNKHFMHWMAWLSKLYKDGGPHFTKEPGLEHLRYQLGELAASLGWVLGLSLVGIAFSLYTLRWFPSKQKGKLSSDTIIMLVFPVIYVVYVTMQYKIAYHRNFLLLYPMLTLFAAEGLIVAFNWLINKVSLLKRIRYRIAGSVALGIAIFILCLPGYRVIYSSALRFNKVVDTRSKTIEDLAALGKKESIFVGIEKGLKVSLHDLRTLNGAFSYFNISDIATATSGFTHLLVPSYEYSSRDFEAANTMRLDTINKVISDREISVVGGSKIDFFHDRTPWVPIVSPEIHILEGEPYPPTEMAKYVLPVTLVNSVGIADHYPVKFYFGNLKKGRYELTFEVTGTQANGDFPEVIVLQNSDSIAAVKVTDSNWQSVKIEIYNESSRATLLELKMINDYYDAETGEDRNAYIQNLELRKVE